MKNLTLSFHIISTKINARFLSWEVNVLTFECNSKSLDFLLYIVCIMVGLRLTIKPIIIEK